MTKTNILVAALLFASVSVAHAAGNGAATVQNKLDSTTNANQAKGLTNAAVNNSKKSSATTTRPAMPMKTVTSVTLSIN